MAALLSSLKSAVPPHLQTAWLSNTALPPHIPSQGLFSQSRMFSPCSKTGEIQVSAQILNPSLRSSGISPTRANKCALSPKCPCIGLTNGTKLPCMPVSMLNYKLQASKDSVTSSLYIFYQAQYSHSKYEAESKRNEWVMLPGTPSIRKHCPRFK